MIPSGWRPRALVGLAICTGLLASACLRTATPPLVRDGADLFSADARAAAESRLQDLAAQRGLWAFVITDSEADPPRMLDAPMAEADEAHVRAVAVLVGPDRLAGTGYSRTAVASGAQQTLLPPDVDPLLARGDADAALRALVDYLVAWAVAPPPAGAPPPVPVERPTDGP